MSDLCREQYPLLCDDLSEEEHFSPQYNRRHRPMSCRGRARNNLKGAAAIITRWPEHLSNFLIYWWIGLGMICLTTFIIYNCLFTFSMLPPANFTPIRPRVMANIIDHIRTAQKTPSLPDVYMHVLADYGKEVDLNKYLPYIKAISSKYVGFKYHLIVVFNDTNINAISAEDNNEIALNSLWTKDYHSTASRNMVANVKIDYISLSKYMDSSPLRKYWRTVSNQLIGFLVRAVSIWEKGGIAFNPLMLTLKSPYAEKLGTILQKYESITTKSNSKHLSKHIQFQKKSNKTNKLIQNVNNIRDIIDVLEHEDVYSNMSEQVLTEAEDRNTVVTHSERKLLSTELIVEDNETEMLTPNIINSGMKLNNISLNHAIQNNNSSTMSLLPLFLEFLFHRKPNNNQDIEDNQIMSKEKSIPYEENSQKHIINESENILNSTNSLRDSRKKLDDVTYKTMIIPAQESHVKIETMNVNELDKVSSQVGDIDQLIIDLKGNVIATRTACHAFLGTIFSNAIHHAKDETITDFIITELSIFCKGVLSSCMGIDLISL